MDLKSKNYINSAKYLPPALAKNTYYSKICSLIDSLLSTNSEYFEYELDALGDVINKYRDIDNLRNITIHQVVREFGYQYIIDILELPDSRLRDLVAYLALINMLKGTKAGLELVLSLLGFDFKLLEWFEDPILLPERNTYALELIFKDMGMKSDFYRNFYRFSREYVYPLLAKLVVYFKYSYGRVWTGCAIAARPKLRIYPGDD
jgi:hypothetical protein